MNIPGILLFTLLGSVTFTAYMATMGTIFSSLAGRARDSVRAGLWKSFFLGLVNYLFFGLIAIALFRVARENLTGFLAAIFTFLALVLLAALFILTSFGLGGFNHWFRERTSWEENLPNALRSAFLLALACMAPFVGWFLMTPFVLATSLGAGIQALFRRAEKPAA